jgi:hypothetical protein
MGVGLSFALRPKPMRIGITGHRHLEDSNQWTWVRLAITNALEERQVVSEVNTCLAIGADQLFAEVALGLGLSVHAVLPFPDYDRTFAPKDLPQYRHLLIHSTIEVMPSAETDEDGYLIAGKRIVDLSDILFAVWDGKLARGKGGTGEIVEYAIEKGRSVLHFNPIDKIEGRIRSAS